MSHLVRFEVEVKITPSDEAWNDLEIVAEAVKYCDKHGLDDERIRIRPVHVEPPDLEEEEEE